MNVNLIAGTANFRRASAKLKNVKSASVAGSSPGGKRDTVQLNEEQFRTASEEGYIEVNGRKFAVSEEMAKEIDAVRERVAAYNQAKALTEAAEQNAQAAKQQAKAAAEQAKAQAKALEIYRRIANGGRVPPEDEQFLQDFSPELYLAAKMAALTAQEHEDYDSVLEDEEASENGDGAASDEANTVEKVAVSVSDGETPSVESVSTVSVELSE